MKYATIIILAGGQSSRFWPLSHKNLLTVAGQPILEYQLSHYAKIAEKVLVVCRDENFQECLDCVKHENVVVIEQKGEGMSSAVISAKEHIQGSTLIVNANDFYDTSYIEWLSDNPSTKDADVVLVAVKVSEYVPGGYLRLENDNVVAVIEKPGADAMPSPYFKLVLDYFKDGATFVQTLENVPNDGVDDVYERAMTQILESGKLSKYVVYEGDWATMKYPWHVHNVKDFFLKKLSSHISSSASVHETAIINGNVFIDDGAKVYEYAKITGPAYIGKNVIVGNYALVTESLIEQDSLVGAYTEVTRSYLGKNVYTHRNFIGDSIIEGPANIGGGAVIANLRFDRKTIGSFVKGEKIDTGRSKLGLIAGKNLEIGVNSVIMPGVKVGTNTIIGALQNISKDIHPEM